MSLLPLLDLGTSGNDGTGDSLREGGQIINDKFTELYAATNELRSQRTFYVDGIMGDDATAAPFKTLSMALSAITGGGTADAPWTIILQGGDITEANAITMALPYVNIWGQGIKASRILFTAGHGLTINASNVTLSDLCIERSGSGAGTEAFLLHVNTTSLATWKNARFDRVGVRNPQGVAISTFSGDARDIDLFAKIGIEWCYGGRLFNPYIHAHDPALGAEAGGYPTSACIMRIQSCSPSIGVLGGAAVFSATEEYLNQRGGVFGGFLINTDPNGICVNGLSEDYLGDNTTSDWYYQLFSGAPGTPLNGGQPYVSWYPSPIMGTYIICPLLAPGLTALDLGTNVRGVGTGGGLRGTLRLHSCEVYGTRLASYLRDSDTQSGSWVTENSNYGGALDLVQACSFTSVSFLIGDTRVGYLDGVRRVNLSSGNAFNNCHNQGEWAFVMEGDQYMMTDCTDISFRDFDSGFLPKDKRSVFDWRSPESQCVRLNGLGQSYLKTEGAINGDYANSLVARTFELWFRCDNTIAVEEILFTYTGDTLSQGTLVTVVPSTGQLYGYAAGVLVGNQSGLSFANAHATIVCTEKNSLVQGEYIDLAYGGATNRFWFDKVGDSSSPPANPGTLTRVNLSGAADTATGTGAALRTAINTLLSATLDSSETAGVVTVARRVTGTLFASEAVANSNFVVTNITAHWHHLQLSVTGGPPGTGTIYLDGVAITGSAGGVPVVTGAGALRIGVSNSGTQLFKGDITEVRVSNVARDPALRKTHWQLDANTLGLWDHSTRRNLGWTDQTGAHDMHFAAAEATAHSSAPNIPYWVRRNRSLEWLHATNP